MEFVYDTGSGYSFRNLWKKAILTNLWWGMGAENVLVHWFIPQIPAIPRTWPDWSWEPATLPGSLTWVAGMQPLEPSLVASWGLYLQECDSGIQWWQWGPRLSYSTERVREVGGEVTFTARPNTIPDYRFDCLIIIELYSLSVSSWLNFSTSVFWGIGVFF